jgi:hypothetical protein
LVFAGVGALLESVWTMRFFGVFAGSMGVTTFFAGVGALPLVVPMESARTPRFLSAIIGICISFPSVAKYRLSTAEARAQCSVTPGLAINLAPIELCRTCRTPRQALARRPVWGFETRVSSWLQIHRFGAAGIGLSVERYALTFRQAARPGRLDGCGMHIHILFAAVWRNKSEALSDIEKLHCSDGHDWFLFIGFQLGKMQSRRERTLVIRIEVGCLVQART